MNNPSLESYYIFVFKYYAFDHFFDILKELISSFQMCVMNSETINGSVDTKKTVIAKILNKSQWSHHKRVLT